MTDIVEKLNRVRWQLDRSVAHEARDTITALRAENAKLIKMNDKVCAERDEKIATFHRKAAALWQPLYDHVCAENAKLRAAALEEAAKLVDGHAAAYEACMSRGDDDGTLEAVAASLRGRAANIRSLKNQNPDSAALGGDRSV